MAFKNIFSQKHELPFKFWFCYLAKLNHWKHCNTIESHGGCVLLFPIQIEKTSLHKTEQYFV